MVILGRIARQRWRLWWPQLPRSLIGARRRPVGPTPAAVASQLWLWLAQLLPGGAYEAGSDPPRPGEPGSLGGGVHQLEVFGAEPDQHRLGMFSLFAGLLVAHIAIIYPNDIRCPCQMIAIFSEGVDRSISG